MQQRLTVHKSVGCGYRSGNRISSDFAVHEVQFHYIELLKINLKNNNNNLYGGQVKFVHVNLRTLLKPLFWPTLTPLVFFFVFILSSNG